MRSAGFLVQHQNQGRRFVSGLASKPLGQFVSGLASKPLRRFVSGLATKLVVQVSWFGPQNQQLQFSDLGIRITAMVSWFGPEN
jgi:hypothetical protein